VGQRGRIPSDAVWPWPATKGPRGSSIDPPPTGVVVRRMERKKGKNLMGWDKGSLTEQQTKGR